MNKIWGYGEEGGGSSIDAIDEKRTFYKITLKIIYFNINNINRFINFINKRVSMKDNKYFFFPKNGLKLIKDVLK